MGVGGFIAGTGDLFIEYVGRRPDSKHSLGAVWQACVLGARYQA